MLNVSRRSVQSAVAVRATAPAVFAVVKAGRLPVSQAVHVARMAPERHADVVQRIQAGERTTFTVLSAARAEKAQQIERAAINVPLSALGRAFPVLYADPPWRYETPAVGGGRVTELHYPTMLLADICALPVAEIAASDSVLFMWALPSMIPEALEGLAAWGFEWKTHGAWKKPRMSTGFWLRDLDPSS